MMPSQGHETKGEGVKFQVGRRGGQQKQAFNDCMHHLINPDLEFYIRDSPKRVADSYYVFGGVVVNISDKVLRRTGQQWNEPGWLRFNSILSSSQSGEVKAR